MGLSSNILWHQTNKDGLLQILKKKMFLFSYSKEKVLDKPLKIAFPMISFCDLPFSEFSAYISKYGGYSIGMDKIWGYKNHCNPVWYCYTGSLVKRRLTALMTNELNVDDVAMDSVLEMLAYIKPLEGELEVRGRKCLNYRFADEREVRLVPQVSFCNEHKLNFMLSEEEYLKYKTEHGNSLLPLGVAYEWADVKYIVVKNPENVKEIKDLLERLGCNNNYIHVFHQQQIKEDFIGIDHDIMDTPFNKKNVSTLRFKSKPIENSRDYMLKA